MVLFIHRAGALTEPDPAARLLPAAQHLQYLQAEQLLGAAHADAALLAAQAREAYEAERRRGYAEGRAQAGTEAAEQMLEHVARGIDYFAGIEGRMTELVLQAMRRLVADYSERERVVMVVRGALAAVRGQTQVILRVAPDRVELLRSALDELLTAFPSIGHIDLQADARLRDDGCVVETEIGVVEASIEAQLEAMRRAFAKVFGSGRQEAHASL